MYRPSQVGSDGVANYRRLRLIPAHPRRPAKLEADASLRTWARSTPQHRRSSVAQYSASPPDEPKALQVHHPPLRRNRHRLERFSNEAYQLSISTYAAAQSYTRKSQGRRACPLALLTAPVKGHPLHLLGIGLIQGGVVQHQQPRKPGLPATAPPAGG